MGNIHSESNFVNETMNNIKKKKIILYDENGYIIGDELLIFSLRLIYYKDTLSKGNKVKIEMVKPYFPLWWNKNFEDIV